MGVAWDHTESRRVSGDEKTEEACGGCRQGHPRKAKTEEEDLPREVAPPCTLLSKRATTAGTAAAGLSRQTQESAWSASTSSAAPARAEAST
jgi:hypothetical protein